MHASSTVTRVVPPAMFALATGAVAVALLAGCGRTEPGPGAAPAAPRASEASRGAPAPTPAEAPAPDVAPPPAPEGEGSSPRRVRWTDVVVDEPPAPPEKLAKAGAGVYAQQCVVCHGTTGKGDGPASGILTTPPRDFTTGRFKFKTSKPGAMPFDDDLYRTISAGIPAAGMPSFGDLTAFERWALVAHVKTLAKTTLEDGEVLAFFTERPATGRIALPPPPSGAPDLAHGAAVFRSNAECLKCHGEQGLGDGPSSNELKDEAGRPIRPPDLTRGEVTFKAGSRVEDVYRVLTTGMEGTPMPAFTTLSEADRWAVAQYVLSLYRPIPPGERVYLRTGCTSCHSIGKGKLIGPDLAGVSQRRDAAWLKRWLKDPPSMLATDATARKLLEEFLTPMPSYGLSDAEVDLLIGYMQTLPPAPPAPASGAK